MEGRLENIQCNTSLTFRLDKDFGFLPPIICLFVPAVRLSIVVHCTFPVAGAFYCTRNSLPCDTTFSPSLLTFKQ